MEWDFQFEIILSRWWPWCHFMQKTDATKCVSTKCLPGSYAAIYASSSSYLLL